ncbi:MAG TPA: hypothetical protein P5052_03860 [Candidatus Paceibacterota bacterium]|jgi:hypothetical protein|nr:hypothetical protein [Candidatus Paceibacterota bacterium]HRZ29848.1 hypothetical protein [Candidatus Paceibacterota bacterium]
MIAKMGTVVNPKRGKVFNRLTVFFENKHEETEIFFKKAELSGILIKYPHQSKEEIVPVILKLNSELQPSKIRVDFGDGVIISIDPLTAKLLLEQNRVTGEYGDGANKIVLIKLPKDPNEENDLAVLQLLVENSQYRK